ncbi:MAG: MBL fold metallo-hydrolase [Candidatus Verstraetearchaeota archaeon]|nr:MBL fold metallo-hydrolase [Candidatus Verstraetearchaeota archaeon]
MSSYVNSLKLYILSENTVLRQRDLLGEHGFSVLIDAESEAGRKVILFDTGQTGSVLVNNANVLKAPLKETEVICLSHGHFDHSGGLISALKQIRRSVRIYLHPHAILPKYKKVRRKLVDISLPHDVREIERYRGILQFNTGPVELAPGILLTGEVPRENPYEEPENFFMKQGSNLVRDFIKDDQAIVINTREGLVVVTGCGHSGIVNIINYAKRLAKVDEVCAIIGGLHLAGAKKPRLEFTINAFKDANPKLLAPCHCTGYEEAFIIKSNLPKQTVQAAAGAVFTLP